MSVSFLDKVWDFGKSVWDSTDPNRRPPESDLSKFVAQVKQHGLARTSKFLVTMDTPNCLRAPERIEALTGTTGDLKLYSEMLGLLCKSAQLPGVTYDTSAVYTFGHFEVPYNKAYDTLSLTFYVDSKMDTKKYFDHWMDCIQLYSTKGFAFYESFVTTVNIDVINQESNAVYSVQLHEAYPKSMSAIELDYGNNDVMLLTITFQYKSWISTSLAIPEGKDVKGILDQLFGGNPIYEGAKSALGTIGAIFTTVDEYTGRFERVKGLGKGVENQAKGLPGIFKSKVSRVKDLGKWL